MSDISSRNTADLVTDCSPLSQACIKALTDRMDDKRKFAANEIEKMTVEFSMSNNLVMVNRLIILLGRRFCLSHSQNTRKGGLLGLAAVMVGFKNGAIVKELPAEMVEEVVRPILTCLLDSDSRVRYFACESLFNVTKVAGQNILPMFESIFDTLTRLVADPDLSVRVGSETLDRLLKDIVVASANGIDLENFIVKLEEYIYTKNPFTRMLIISWIRLLDSKLDMINHLPRLLDGILNCLYDSTEEICASTLVLLSEFLNKIVTRPTDKLDIPSFINTLLKHARNDREDPVQYTAIAWLRQFIRLMDGPDLIRFSPSILSAILPCLALQVGEESLTLALTSDHYQQQLSHRHHQSTTLNNTTMQPYQPSRSTYNVAPFSAANQGNICEISTLVNSSLQELVVQILSDRKKSSSSSPSGGPTASASNPADSLDQKQQRVINELEVIIEVLSNELQKQDHPVIKLAILDWFKALKKAEPQLILNSVSQQKLFQTLLETLSARSDAVVKNTIRVITEVFCDDPTGEQQQQQTAGDLGSPRGGPGGITIEDTVQHQQTVKDDTELSLLDSGATERKKSPAPRGATEPSLSKSSSVARSQQQLKGSPGKRVAINTASQEQLAAINIQQQLQQLQQQQQQPQTNFHKFIQALYKTFHENDLMFEDRSKFIVVNLCSMTKPETVYRSFADIIKDEKSDPKFAYNLVQKLNQILLTAPALFGLRARMSNCCLESNDTGMVTLFNSLLIAWSPSPIASVTLCLLAGNYKQAKDLVLSLAKAEITMDILIQVDWVVQLIESPVFAPLRLRLLDTTKGGNDYLVQTLYGLLMVLPQSDAYKKLSHRLDQVHKFMNIHGHHHAS